MAHDLGHTGAWNALHDMNERVTYLNEGNYHIWCPLCAKLPDRNRNPAYALDLLKAAGLLSV
ncbi:hypothetical protein ACFYWH_45260 [Streptomyces sp. NPDC003737]|uniref:hypothetical protein n=1 Tax=Streptomyces sp. NPDC003737 TaxID=3364685 RepID=UPI0036B958FD